MSFLYFRHKKHTFKCHAQDSTVFYSYLSCQIVTSTAVGCVFITFTYCIFIFPSIPLYINRTFNISDKTHTRLAWDRLLIYQMSVKRLRKERNLIQRDFLPQHYNNLEHFCHFGCILASSPHSILALILNNIISVF